MIIIAKKDTKEKIIRAALDEFSEKGYEHASTNCIVNRAGVGKGMLFYYFKNKEELYRYLVNESISQIEDLYYKGSIFKSKDFLERCMELSRMKMDRYMTDPQLFNFMGNSYLNDYNVPELKDIIAKELEISTRMHEDLYNDLDMSALRDDIDPDDLIAIIKWTIDGYEATLINTLKGQDLTKANLEPYWDEFDKLIENLKTIYYK